MRRPSQPFESDRLGTEIWLDRAGDVVCAETTRGSLLRFSAGGVRVEVIEWDAKNRALLYEQCDHRRFGATLGVGELPPVKMAVDRSPIVRIGVGNCALAQRFGQRLAEERAYSYDRRALGPAL